MAFLTISLCSQLLATQGDEFGLFEPFSRVSDLPPIAAGCVRSAP
jgi:hypothetical protein